ncbi:MAG: TRAP transporter small permease [Firmicutes bacterium]|nr:TRAP transporter small permease [Bacillota bacterium]
MDKFKWLTKAIRIACAVLMAFCACIVFVQVFRRYIFGSVFKWAEEVAIFSVIWITFLASVLCLKDGEHTRIEVFINLFPHKIRKWIEVFDYLVCFAFMMILCYHSVDLLRINGNFRPAASNIPMKFVYSSIMVSGILMIPYFAILIINKIKEKDPKLAAAEETVKEVEG